MTITTSINYMIDMSGKAGSYAFRTVGIIIAPAILGHIGGRLTGAGAQIGLLQGAVSATYHNVIHIPIQKYIHANTGYPNPKKGEISPESARFFRGVGFICSLAAPILVTWYCAPMLNKACQRLPEGFFKKLMVSENKKEYGILTAISIAVAPIMTQHLISFLRKDELYRN